MTIRPVRLQLSRKRGFNLQELSRATNGLFVVNVARPSRWGNPFRIGQPITGKFRAAGKTTNEDAVEMFRILMEAVRNEGAGVDDGFLRFLYGKHPVPTMEHIRINLGGRNLACWCAPGQPCHASILLELANA